MFRMCYGGDNDDSSTSSMFDMYFFARHDYEIPFIVYVCCHLFLVII